MPREPEISFRCTEEERNAFTSTVKARGMTREEALLPMVQAFIREPGIIERISKREIVARRVALTAEEREIIEFVRNAGKSTGAKGELEISVLRDLRRWITVLKGLH